jgi:hypothetical protein
VLEEVHEGECGDHTGGQTLARKILRYGYYWPTVNRDAADYARRCDKCQIYAKIPRAPPTELTQMVSPWPFAMWGIDLIGSLPIAKGGAKYAIVAVDYFTKWAEAEPMATITTKKVINFVVRNIICRFGLPRTIITDNGTQFESKEFKEFCQRYGIEKRFAAVAHPKANGQVEAVNKIIKSILKKRLEKARGKWVDELPTALWAYRTTHKTATGHTPFALAYGTEAVIPVELEVPSHRVTYYDPASNQDLLLESLDFIDEKREEADLRAASYRHRVAKYYNGKVQPRTFSVGDLVLKRVFPTPSHMNPAWEGPYVIERRLGEGTFKLTTVDGATLPRAWNSEHLRRYYT